MRIRLLCLLNSLFSSFINTVAGWVNLLLLSSSGPIKIPVGAWQVARMHHQIVY